MTDYSELKRLAEAATPGRVHDRLDSCGGGLKYECFGDDGSLVLKVDHKNDEWGFIGGRGEHDEAFFLACAPSAVLALIAENESLRIGKTDLRKDNKSLRGSREAVGKEFKMAKRERNAAIRERDQLKAVNFDFQMGVGADAEEIAQLQAEVESLRKALGGLLELYEDDEGCKGLPQYLAGVAAMSKQP